MALLASVLVAPLAINAYAQESVQTEELPETQTEEQNQEQEEEQETEPEESTPPSIEEEAVEEDEQPVDEEETVAPQEVDLAGAIGIAKAQHPDSEVILAKVKLKKLSGEKVYKIVLLTVGEFTSAPVTARLSALKTDPTRSVSVTSAPVRPLPTGARSTIKSGVTTPLTTANITAAPGTKKTGVNTARNSQAIMNKRQ